MSATLTTDTSLTTLSIADRSAPPISVPDLPEDVFLLILSDLDAWDTLNCQRVSKPWRLAFSKEEYLRVVLQRYPNAREVRDLGPEALKFRATHSRDIDWGRLFRTVAYRYHSLTHGLARKAHKYPMAPLEQLGDWFPVGQWDYHESQPGGRLYYETAATHLSRSIGVKPYLFRPTLWSYSDGLLVYAPRRPSEETRFPPALSLLDVDTGEHYPVPFNARDKIIRNLSLRDRTLVIEWAEKDPFHHLNAMDQVNRHFANCFDVRRDDTDTETGWKVTWRSEWKMHFLGLPPNYHDRFFSTHNSKHYAVYFWQPNRSLYTGDEELPIESLSIWDISHSSTYRPSVDPSGKFRPSESEGPHIVSRFSFTDMEHLGIRQHASVSLMSLHLDSVSMSLTVRENAGIQGQGYFDPAERLWCAKTTTFPFLGLGPVLQREWDGNLPPYRGHCSMESTDVEEPELWFLPIMDVVDEAAEVRLSLVETCFSGQMMENKLLLRIKTRWGGDGGSEAVALDEEIASEVTSMGRIAGDERWVIGQNERMEIVVARF